LAVAAPVVTTAVVTTGTAVGQNSTRKIRPQPSKVAARAGSAVKWWQDLESALAASRKQKKPVFWYVPTLRSSPMDRKREIDRYMMAGPFCWPRLITLLNQHYIPVKAYPRGELARDLDLRPGKFIEPGYVVLDGDGKELRRLDRITTFHPEWFLRPLAKLVGKPVPKRELPAPLASAWDKVRSGNYQEVGEVLNLHALGDLDKAWRAEAYYVIGVAELRQGRSDEALKLWKLATGKFPETNFGWKCAAEAEGHGPFYFGFEVYRELPAKVLEGTAPGSRAPAGAYDEDELRRRSLEFLLHMQRSNGGYTDSRYDFGGTDSLPNVYFACTSLVALALVEDLLANRDRWNGKREDVLAKDPGFACIARITKFLDDAANLNTEDRDELVWAHAYGIRALLGKSRLQQVVQGDQTGLHKLAQRHASALKQLQVGAGSYRHEYPNPFATAAVLQALHMARTAGVKVDSKQVNRGVGALIRCRGDSGGFTYGSVRRGKPRVDVRGAAGRMPLCELALLLWGESDQDKLHHAIEVSLEHHQLMERVRKYDDHAGRYGYGGFFFWFDMLGRTDAILALTDKEQRKRFLRKQREIILSIPEIDGCFVDSHELGRTYGTAMALICLAKIRTGL
jgi:hypothetical protein